MAEVEVVPPMAGLANVIGDYRNSPSIEGLSREPGGRSLPPDKFAASRLLYVHLLRSS
jgi:hypothetical protein